MIFHARVPRPPLSNFVALFWLRESGDKSSDAVPLLSSPERVLPDGAMELIIPLGQSGALPVFGRGSEMARAGSVRGGALYGAHSEFFTIDPAGQSAILGVHFRPGGAFPFLGGVPAGDVQNAVVPLDALWGAGPAGQLREQLLEAEAPHARFDVLERFLLAQTVRPRREPHSAVAYALQTFTDTATARPQSVAAVAGQVGLSPRRFIRVFEDEVGLTPKRFSRVRRFQDVLRHVERGQAPAGPTWASVALACGYYDQAHFANDFRAFCGLSPTEYLARRGERFGHVPLARE